MIIHFKKSDFIISTFLHRQESRLFLLDSLSSKECYVQDNLNKDR